jgi:hypothetical protein
MKLEDVYWDEAMDIVISTSGLRKSETDNIIKIMTSKEFDDEKKGKESERDAFRKEKIEKQRIGEEFVTETFYLNYVNPIEMEKVLSAVTAFKVR